MPPRVQQLRKVSFINKTAICGERSRTMITNLFKIIFGILILFIIVNLLLLDFVWLKGKPAKIPELATTTEEENICQPACLEKIQEEAEKLTNKLPVSQAVVSPTPEVSKTTPPKATPTTSPSVTYLTIGSSGWTQSTSWVDIAGTEFYFNLTDYTKVKSVRWEVNVRSFLGGNLVYVRLYDVTNSRAVDNSEMPTTSSTSVILRSTDLTIWQGNNLYRVQAKSDSGNPVYVDAPRLKIFLE